MFQKLKTKNQTKSIFIDLRHPRAFTQSAGVSSSVTKANEASRLVRCRHCGWVCDKERDVNLKDGSYAGFGINQGSKKIADSSIGDIMSSMSAVKFTHYKMNDNAASTTVVDDGNGSNNGIASANTDGLTATGKINEGLDLETSSSIEINIDGVARGIASDPEGTFSFWFNPESLPANNVLLYIGDDRAVASADLLQVVIETTGVVNVVLQDEGITQWQIKSDGTLSTGTFHHIAITHDGSSPKLYIDGIGDGGRSVVNTDLTVWFSGLSSIDTGRIGANRSNGSSLGFIDGIIDDFRYYNTGLSFDEVKALFNTGVGTEGEIFGRVPDRYFDRSVNSGCPCCGSYVYDPFQPIIEWPMDRYTEDIHHRD